MTQPLPIRSGCRWLTAYEHAFETGSLRKPDKATVRCCNCGTAIDYMQAWVTVPYGLHGNRLPLPVFIHCVLCVEALDPLPAYQAAFQRDRKASEPDPDKVKRELELNQRMAEIPGFENEE